MIDAREYERTSIPEGITRDDVLRALLRIESGDSGGFGDSRSYDLVHDGKPYPPKAALGLAAERLLGRPMTWRDFKGGEDTECFQILESLGFTIRKRSGELRGNEFLPEDPPERIWIEFVNDPNHGGEGWAFGTCLWSPSKAADGKDWFSPMRSVQPDDLVLHAVTGEFTGWSFAKSGFREVQEEPPDAGRWAGMAPYYRIDLAGFRAFSNRIAMATFLKNNESAIEADRAMPDRPKFYPFVRQGGLLRKFEGAYLSPCTDRLYQLIRNAAQHGSVATNLAHADNNDVVSVASRYWVIAPGKGGRLWNECQEKGIITIGWDYLGDLLQHPSQAAITEAIIDHEHPEAQPTNSSLCCWQFANELKPGDFLIAKGGRQRILGIGTVESDYSYEPTRAEHCHVRRVKWLRAKSVDMPAGELLPTKTLTDVSDDAKLLEMIKEHFLDTTPAPEPASAYTLDDAVSEVFISREQFEVVLRSLQRKKNVILQGPPGVGKTFLAKRLAYALLGTKDDTRIQLVQFHQSYAYEDFVQGWRPTGDGGFRLKNGIFYEFCDLARVRLDEPHVFIIDEINRGNLSKILGELMMLMEPDKRGAEHAIPLTYSESAERFSVPANIFVLGLMNTADRSLAMVDYALRRRFRFIDLRPEFSSLRFAQHLRSLGVEDVLIQRIITRLTTLNEKIEADHKNLGRGFVIGHSFFCASGDGTPLNEDWYRAVIEQEIGPLLEEYWFDRRETSRKWIEELLRP